mgnify:CR=1 FL=1
MDVWKLALSVIIGALLGGGVTYSYVNSRVHGSAEISKLREEVRRLRALTTSSSWVSEGVTHTIVTTREEGEEVDVFLARHKAAVDAAKLIWPPS